MQEIFDEVYVTLSVSNTKHTHYLSEDGVHRCSLTDLKFCSNLGTVLPPENHEGVGRLLDVWLDHILCTLTFSLSMRNSENRKRA